MDLRNSVSIIGRACRLPGCDSFDEFRDAVLVGRDLTDEIPPNRWLLDGVKLMYPSFRAGFVESIDLFDNKYFNISSEEALAMDPSQRVLLELTVEALDSTGLSLSSVALARTAVFVAQNDSSEYAEMIDEPSRYHTAGTHAALTAGRIASFLNSMRGAVTVETACSSALTALHMARKCLLEQECEFAIVAAANTVISDKHLQSLLQSRVVSSSGRSALFDNSANGYVPSEAFAVFVLEKTGNSRPAHGIILSSAISSDGAIPRNPESQENLLQFCLKTVKSVDFVQTHGADSVELGMLQKCVDGKFKFVSGKSLLGHSSSVSGLVGILHSLVVLSAKTYPAQLHLNLTTVDPGMIALINEEQPVQRCLVNSFGLGGSNACALIEKCVSSGNRPFRRGPTMLLLSATTTEALRRKCAQLIGFLDETNLPLSTVCYSASHVNHYNFRKAVYGITRAQIQNSIANPGNPITIAEKNTFTVKFHHTAYRTKNSYRSLYNKEETFRKKVDEVLTVIAMYGRPHFKHRLFEGPTGNEDGLLFDLTISYAYFQTLEAHGLKDTVASGQGMTFINALAALRCISVRQAVEYIINQRSTKTLLLSLSDPRLRYRGVSLVNFSVDEIAREMDTLSVISCTSHPLSIKGLEAIDEDRNEWESFQLLLGELFLKGVAVRFPDYSTDNGPLPDLPAYPFEKVSFWPKQLSIEPMGEVLYTLEEIHSKLSEFELQYPDKRDFEAKLMEEFELSELDLGSENLATVIFEKQKPALQKITSEEEDASLMISLLTLQVYLPGGDHIESLWDSVKVGRDLIVPMTRKRQRHVDFDQHTKVYGGFLEHIEKFDNQFFNMTEDEVYQMCYEERLIRQCVEDTVERAGCPDFSNSDIYLTASGRNEHSTFLGHLARQLGVGGRAVVVESGCTSVTSCLEAAMVKMNLGATDYSIIIASNVILSGSASQEPKDYGTFDVDNEGQPIPLSEGVGCLILRKYTSLQKLTAVHSKAVLRFCVTKQGNPLESLINLLGMVNLEVDYLEAHGNHPEADSVHMDVSNKCFHRVHVGSLKSNIGHSEIASGIPAIAKCVRVLTHDYSPAQLHLKLPYPTARNGPGHATLPFIGYDRRALDTGVISSGKNGSNAYTLLSCIPMIQEYAQQVTGHSLILVSAKEPRSLKVVIERTKNFINETSEPLYDVARSLQTFKRHHKYRAYFIGKSHQEIVRKMTKPRLFRPKDPMQVHLYLGHLDRDERFTAMIDMTTSLINFGVTKLPIVAAGRPLIASCVAAQVLTLAEAIELRDLHKSGKTLQLMRVLRSINFNKAVVELRNPKGTLIDGFEPFIDGLLVDRDYRVELDSFIYIGDHSGLHQAIRVETERDFLDLLGRFYLSGMDMNWNAFTVPFKRMNLPTYPYKLKPFWPKQSYAYLCGHRLGSEIVVPEATLVDLALDNVPGALKNVNFKKPLTTTKDLELNLTKLGEYFSYEADEADTPCAMPTIPGRETSKLEFYEEMTKKGFNYQGAFKSVKYLRGNTVYVDRVRSADLVLQGMFQAILFQIPRRARIVHIDHISAHNLFEKKSAYIGKFELCKRSSTTVIANVRIDSDQDEPYLYVKGVTLQTKHMYPNQDNYTIVHEERPEKKIGIRAISCRLPGNVTDPQELWDYLKTGRNSAKRIPLSRVPTRNALIKGDYGNVIEGANCLEDDIAEFDHKFFKISKSEAEKMDPQQRLLLECVQEVLERSALTNLDSAPVYIGLMGAEYPDLMENPKDVLSMLGSSASVLSGRVNYVFGSSGCSMTLDTACSSSLTALDLAVQAIRSGAAIRAVVGGVNLILTEKGLGQRANGKMLASDGKSRTFDHLASGYGRADGCVVAIIQKMEKGVRYMGIIEETAVNHCGTGIGLSTPNGLAQEKLLRQIIRSPDTIDVWEVHGTGTSLGDPIEANALGRVFRDRGITVSSIKANLGHSEAAAGLSGILKMCLQLQHDYVPPMAHLEMMNTNIKANCLDIPICGTEIALNRGGVTSFGVSGTNAATVISKACWDSDEEEYSASTTVVKTPNFVDDHTRSSSSSQDLKIDKSDIRLHAFPDRFMSVQDLTKSLNRRCKTRRRFSALSKLSSLDYGITTNGSPPSRSSSPLPAERLRHLSTVSQVSSQDYEERSNSIDEQMIQSFQNHVGARLLCDPPSSVQNLTSICDPLENHRLHALYDHSQSCRDLLQYDKSNNEQNTSLNQQGITENLCADVSSSVRELHNHTNGRQSSEDHSQMNNCKHPDFCNQDKNYSCQNQAIERPQDQDQDYLPATHDRLSSWDPINRASGQHHQHPHIGVLPVSAKSEKSLDFLLEAYRKRISESSDWLTLCAREAAHKPVFDGCRAVLVISEPHRTVEVYRTSDDQIPVFGFDLPAIVELDYGMYYRVPLFKKHLDTEIANVEPILQGKVQYDVEKFHENWKNAFMASLRDLGLENCSILGNQDEVMPPTFWFNLENMDLTEFQIVVGHLFIQGIDIHWDKLYDLSAAPTVILPTYNFDRIPLWFKNRQTDPHLEFLGQLISQDSGIFRFENLITVSRYRNLYDLSIGRVQMTCGFLLEILAETGRYFFDSMNFEISKINVATIEMEDHLWITIECHVYSDNNINVQIFTENRIEPICEADITVIDTLREDKQLFNIRTTVPPSQIYKGLKFYQGITYSNALQCLTDVDKISSSAVAVSLPSDEDYCIDPGLLEAAVQLGLCATDSSSYVVFARSISKVYIYQNLQETALIHFSRESNTLELLNKDHEIAVKIILEDRAETVGFSIEECAETIQERTRDSRSLPASLSLQMTIERVQRAVADIMSHEIDVAGQGFMDMGLDSMMLIDLVNRLNSIFPGVQINTNDLFNHPNVEELGKAIHSRGYGSSSTIQNDKEYLPDTAKTNLEENIRKDLLKKVETSETTVTQESTIQQVYNIVVEIMVDDKEIPRNQGFFELGLDSMMLIDFINRLNTVFPTIRLNTNDLFNYPNIEELGKAIHDKLESTVSHTKGKQEPQPLVRKIGRTTRFDTATHVHEAISENEVQNRYSNRKNLRVKIQDDKLDKEEPRQYPKTPKIIPTVTQTVDIAYTVVPHVELYPEDLQILHITNFYPLELDKDLSDDIVNVKIETNLPYTEDVPKGLKNLGNYLISRKMTVLWIDAEKSPIHSLIAGFLRSLSTEYPTRVRFQHNIRLSKTKLTRPDRISPKQPRTWLITGGASGIGEAMGDWLLQQNYATRVIRTSRSKTNGDTVAIDVTDKSAMEALFVKIGPNLQGIIHSAGVLKDSRFSKQTADTIKTVLDPKVKGLSVIATLADRYAQNLEYFIINSSISGILGNEGQIGYSAANAFMDTVMQKRRKNGKPGTTINWGNWRETGMATKWNDALEERGFTGITVAEGLSVLEHVLHVKPIQLAAARIDWSKMMQTRPDLQNIVLAPGKTITEVVRPVKVGFLISGQGSQYWNMGKELYETYDVYRKALDYCSSMFGLVIPIKEVIFNSEYRNLVNESEYVQSILFATSYALSQLWISFGIYPDVLIGHSVGEILALVLAGCLSLEEAVKLVTVRGRCMEKLKNRGLMIALHPSTAENYPNLEIVAKNSPNQVIVAGTHEDLKFLLEGGINCKIVNWKYPFHSSLIQDSDIEELREVVVNFTPPTKTVISNGTVIDKVDMQNVIDQLRSPVLFEKSLNTAALEFGITAYIEIGPGMVLTNFAKQTLPNLRLAVNTITQKLSEVENFQSSLSKLHDLGVSGFGNTRILTVNPAEDAEELIGHIVDGLAVVPGAYQVCLHANMKNDGIPLKYSNLHFKNMLPITELSKIDRSGLEDYFYCTKATEQHSVKCQSFPETNEWTPVDEDRFYNTLARNGVEYHNQFQILKDIGRFGDFVEANLRSTDRLYLVIEGAFQALSVAAFDNYSNHYFVPVTVGLFVFDLENIAPNANSWSVRGKAEAMNEKFIEGYVEILNQGTVVGLLQRTVAVVTKKTTNHYEALKSPRFGRRNAISEGLDAQITVSGYSSQFVCDWDGLIQGHISRDYRIDWQPDYFDAEFFGISPKEAECIDPQQKLILELTYRTMEDCGIPNLPETTGVYMGVSSADFANRAYAEIPYALGYLAAGTNPSSLAGRISHIFNLKGPSMVFDSACSSFFSALSAAMKDLNDSTVTHALVGAVNLILNEKTTEVLKNTGVLSPDTICRPFDAHANGYVRAEGAAVILLQRGGMGTVISACALKHQGRSAGLTVPNGISQADVYKIALKESGCVEADFLECHGTGTVLGDAVEMSHIPHGCIGSVKSILGHTEAAAGAASFVTALKNIEHGYRNPQVHFTLRNQGVKDGNFEIPVIGTEKEVKTVSINCFGISGTNSTVVLEESIHPQTVVNSVTVSHVLVLSAKSERSLKAMIKQMNRFLDETIADLGAVASMLQKGRKHYKCRSAIVVDYRIRGRFEYRSPEKARNIVLNLEKFNYFHEDIIHELYHNCTLFRTIFQMIQATVPHLHERYEQCEFIFKLILSMLLVNLGIDVHEFKNDDLIKNCLNRRVSLWRTLELGLNTTCEEVAEYEIRKVVPKMTNKVEILSLNDWFGNHQRPSIQLNRLLARLFENGENILWDQWNVNCQLQGFVKLPGYVFDRKRNWPFEDRIVDNCYDVELLPEELHCQSDNPESVMAAHRKHLRNIKPIVTPVESFPEGLKLLKNQSAPSRLILKFNETEFLTFTDTDKVTNISFEWKQDEDIPLALVLCQMSLNMIIKLHIHVPTVIKSGTVSFVRSLASERPELRYRIVHSERFEDFENELRYPLTVSNVVHYRNGLRYVEKLVHRPIALALRKPNIRYMLIIGGNGGIGRALIDFYQPERVTVISRANGVDCRNLEVLLEAVQGCGEIDTIIHAAGTVRNGLVQNLTREDFEEVVNVKLVGLKNLLEVARVYSTRRIIVISSAASILGSFGQANYALANRLMEEELNASELDIDKLIVNFGPWLEKGILATPEATVIRQQIEENGWGFLTTHEALAPLDEGLSQGQCMVFKPDWQRVLIRNPHLSAFLDTVAEPVTHMKHHMNPTTVEKSTRKSQIDVEAAVLEVIKEVSGYKTLNQEAGFMSLGIDSLMIEAIRRKLQNVFGIEITTIHMYQYPNVNSLCEFIGNCGPETIALKDSEEIQTEINAAKSEHYDPDINKLLDSEAPLDDTIITNVLKIDDSEPDTNASYGLSNSTIHKESLENHEALSDTTHEIAIIGMSGAFSGCSSIREYWTNLLSGKECLTVEDCSDTDSVIAGGLIPEIDKFDYKFFNLTQKDAQNLDPQIRQFILHAWNVLEASGYINDRNRLKIGVVAGAEPSDYCSSANNTAVGGLMELFGRNQKDFVAQWTAHCLNLKGSVTGVYTACSTGLTAIQKAMDEILTNRVDLCLAGAVSLVLPENLGHTIEAPMSSEPHCKPFHPEASGILRGSAVGVVLLKNHTKALEDRDQILGVVKSLVTNSDGREKSSFMAPNPVQQGHCMLDALNQAKIIPEDVGYIECHATGTIVGDKLELEAIKKVYGSQVPRLGSVKANIGHGYAGAAMASVLKCLKMMKTGLIPPQINLECPERIGTLKADFVAIHAFGIGGTNAVMILEKPSRDGYRNPCKESLDNNENGTHTTGLICGTTGDSENQEATFLNAKSLSGVYSDQNKSPTTCTNNRTGLEMKPFILPISAKSESSCLAYCRSLAAYLAGDMDLAIIVNTITHQRELYDYRTFIVARTIEEAISKLNTVTKVTKCGNNLSTDSIAFFCCPQGVQYPEMGKDCGIELSGQVQKDIVVLCYRIMQELNHYGISCSQVFGHSLGEYSALLYGGVLDMDSMKRLVDFRQKLQDSTVNADMVAIRDFVPGPPAECSAILSDNLRCFAGPPGTFDDLDKSSLQFKRLDTEHGYHSSMMDPILPAFKEHLKQYSFQHSRLPIISNVNGNILTTVSPEYLTEHIRSPVRLDLALKKLIEDDKTKIIVEIGPQGILTNLIAEKLSNITVVPTVHSKKAYQAAPETNQLLEAVGQLWSLGVNVKFGPNTNKIDFNLPTYQFDPETCYRNLEKFAGHQFKLYKRVLQVENRDSQDYTFGYEEQYDTKPGNIPNGATVLLIGGTGFLGQAYRSALKNCKIIVKGSRDMDVLDYDMVADVLNGISDLHTVVFLSGKPENAEIKVKGIQNVVKALQKPIENMIMASSLSAFLEIPGDEVYASGNAYLDTVAIANHANVKTVTSIQWPPLKGSEMLKHNKGALKEILEANSLNFKELKEFIRITVGSPGVYAVANHHPKQIRSFFHRNDNGEATKIEEKQLSRRDQAMQSWIRHLNLKDLQDHDNFFALGGHSLNGLSISNDLGVPTSLLFEHPIFTDFLEALEHFKTEPKDAISKTDRLTKIPLTFSQENMFILDQIEKDKVKYCIVYRITFDDSRNPTVLHCALMDMVGRQTSLRTRFKMDSQEILSLTEAFIPLAVAEGVVTVNIDDPYKITVDGQAVTFYQHHILTDGWSMTVFAKDLAFFYQHRNLQDSKQLQYPDSSKTARELIKNDQEKVDTFDVEEKIPKPPHKMPEITIADYGSWQRQHFDYQNLEILKKRLENVPPTRISTSTLEPSKPFGIRYLSVPKALTTKITNLSKLFSTSEYCITLAAFAKLINQWNVDPRASSITVGSPVSGRHRPETHDLIGYFLNNMVFNFSCQDLDDRPVEHVKQVVADYSTFEDVPYHLIERRDLFHVYFNYRHDLDFPKIEIPGLKTKFDQLSMNTAFEMSFTIDITQDYGTRITVEYNTGSLNDEDIDDLLEDYQNILACLDHPRRQHTKRTTFPEYPDCFHYKLVDENLVQLSLNLRDRYFVDLGEILGSDTVIPVDLAHPHFPLGALTVILAGAAYTTKISKETVILDSLDIKKRFYANFYYSTSTVYDLAYVIYTSGSTGDPKGVAVGRNNLLSFLAQNPVPTGRRVVHSVSPAFDVSCFNMFSSIASGARLVSGNSLRTVIEDTVTLRGQILFLTSAMFNALDNKSLQDLSDLEELYVGGDTPSNCNLRKCRMFGLKVTQIYGPTEATVWCLKSRNEDGRVIGPSAEYGNPKKYFELVIQGSSVARGYLGSDQGGFTTNKHCSPEDLALRRNMKVFKTADLVKNRSGNLVYHGRIDQQIKVKGVRVTVASLEANIRGKNPQISQIKILKVDERLLAFTVGEITEKPQGIMVIPVKTLPLNSSGKVDTAELMKNLKIKESSSLHGTAHRLALIWQELLPGVTVVNEESEFFDVGGHSLLLFHVRQKISDTFGVSLPVSILGSLNLRELAEHIDLNTRSTVTTIRVTPGATVGVYCVHAIGGTIYPYYVFPSFLPEKCNIYGIDYDRAYRARTLDELAQFYAIEIKKHRKSTERLVLLGHSLGGILCREIAHILQHTYVIMLDSWAMGTKYLKRENVEAYLKGQFEIMPNAESLLEGALKLTGMLRNHDFTVQDTKIYLFKSKKLGDSSALRENISESTIRTYADNGWLKYTSEHPITVYLAQGDHESMLRPENLKGYVNEIQDIIENEK